MPVPSTLARIQLLIGRPGDYSSVPVGVLYKINALNGLVQAENYTTKNHIEGAVGFLAGAGGAASRIVATDIYGFLGVFSPAVALPTSSISIESPAMTVVGINTSTLSIGTSSPVIFPGTPATDPYDLRHG